MDPNGLVNPSSLTEEGSEMDPDGVRKAGSEMDPNGLVRSRPATEEGSDMDPDG